MLAERSARRGRRHAALLLALALLLCLSACGNHDPICGSYRLTGADADGLSVKAEWMDDGSALLVLKEDGTGTLSRGDAAGSFTWIRSEDVLRLDVAGVIYDARLEGESILLPMDGALLRFERDGTSEEEEPIRTREWYGWWSVENSGGRMPEVWRDCCARLEQGSYGPVLRFWDEESSYSEPLAFLELRRDGDELVCVTGWFLTADLEEGAWRFDPEAERLELSGLCEGGGERFDYRIHLRPWGADWQEEELHEPWRLRDWYRPLIQEGASMPDRIG